MSSSLWIGTTGLAASAKQLDVIGNNLANANTIGFKAGETYFSSMLSQGIAGGAGGSLEVGQGVGVAAVTTQFSQGSFETTGNSTDLAIDGKGFFVVKDEDGAVSYTRAGAFNIDKDGYLSDMSSYRVQGLMFDSAGNTLPGVSDINLLDISSQPKATATINLGMNLNADAKDGETFSTSQTVYDAVGSSATLNVTWEKLAGSNAWSISAELETSDGTIHSATLDAAGLSNLAFTADGQLDNGDPADPADLPLDVIFNFADGPLTTLTWNLTDNAPRMTSYAMSSRVNYSSNDGYPPGLLDSLEVADDGTVVGYFTNGESRNMAQILLADFIDPTGLQKIGSYFLETAASGTPTLSSPGGSGFGILQSNSLEVSNTDVAREFIKMISAQRAYQANSRVITTADQMLTELMNIKR